ncbi:hypothetical protein AEP_02720 [Curvibacter sp. AEP1-3]|nr:hypothetical protein AEP_02720 [Curvibacter sp. AEP1-3]
MCYAAPMLCHFCPSPSRAPARGADLRNPITTISTTAT